MWSVCTTRQETKKKENKKFIAILLFSIPIFCSWCTVRLVDATNTHKIILFSFLLETDSSLLYNNENVASKHCFLWLLRCDFLDSFHFYRFVKHTHKNEDNDERMMITAVLLYTATQPISISETTRKFCSRCALIGKMLEGVWGGCWLVCAVNR